MISQQDAIDSLSFPHILKRLKTKKRNEYKSIILIHLFSPENDLVSLINYHNNSKTTSELTLHYKYVISPYTISFYFNGFIICHRILKGNLADELR